MKIGINESERHNPTIEVNIIFKFPVMYIGWEMDNEAYLVRLVNDNNKYEIAMTTHGSPLFLATDKMREKIEEYIDILEKSRNAMSYVDRKI